MDKSILNDLKKVRHYYQIVCERLAVHPKVQIEVLSVATGIRPCSYVYLTGQDPTKLYHYAHSLERAANPLGLQSVVSVPQSLWYPDKSKDIQEYLRWIEGESVVVWFFREYSTADAIAKATAGEIDAGIVLGYPECCVVWHQGVRKIELARWRLAKRTLVQAENEARPPTLDPSEFSPKSTSHHANLTAKNYPFVSHIACNQCLANRRSPTSKLNRSLDRLVKMVDPDFHERFTRATLATALAAPTSIDSAG